MVTVELTSAVPERIGVVTLDGDDGVEPEMVGAGGAIVSTR